MSVTFEVVEDPARACAALMVGVASGGGHIVLSGGSTPKAANEHFVDAVKANDVDVSRATLWLGDERCVDSDDDRANAKMIESSLLQALPAPPPFERILGELGPQAGAADYERRLHEAGDPRFDLLIVGIGPDGHTLSLFPGQAEVDERETLMVGVEMAGHEPFVPRVSMTFRAVSLARHVVLLAAGEGKAPALARAFGPGVVPGSDVPSSLLPEFAPEFTVLVDGAAAAQLPQAAGA